MTSELTPAEADELERLLEWEQCLPHLYGFPWYRWAKEFFDTKKKAAFLTAANQVSKSATQLRLAIEWATNKTLWDELWPNLLPGQIPNTFWYFFPTKEIWQQEFESKIVPDYLPRGALKDDPTYGWRHVNDKGFVSKIVFNSGVTIYCKSYAQKIKDLQTGSVHALFLDEECPVEYVPELQARIRATQGYLRAVFTATLGQEYWRRVMEPKDPNEEIYRGAFKRTVSLYDSQVYIDGRKSIWTDQRIQEVIDECTSDAEVQRRVFGRFVKSEGLAFGSFDLQRNMTNPERIPGLYGHFSGVDPGSGGKEGHPAAMVFIAVRPDYREGLVYRAWRGDGIPTANPDILNKFRELSPPLLMGKVYDYKDKDFYLVAQSQGEDFRPANKARDEGFGLVNSLFKNGMLKIFRNDVELGKLVTELLTLARDVDKREAADDLCDALRYCCMSIPWDFSHTVTAVDPKKYLDSPADTRTEEQRIRDDILKDRRAFALNLTNKVDDTFEAEMEYWNELSGAGNE
jgi:Terminase large subunit, T4likevirus-type, N-terminal